MHGNKLCSHTEMLLNLSIDVYTLHSQLHYQVRHASYYVLHQNKLGKHTSLTCSW